MSTTMKDRSRERPEISFDPVGPPTPPQDPEETRTSELWDAAAGPPPVDDGETMPRRAARLPSQNGEAMRTVFAYLLDEDDTPPPPPPSAKASAAAEVTSPRPDPHRR